MRRQLLATIAVSVLLSACAQQMPTWTPEPERHYWFAKATWEPTLFPDATPFAATPFPEYTPHPGYRECVTDESKCQGTSLVPPGVTVPDLSMLPPRGREEDEQTIILLGRLQVGRFVVAQWRHTGLQPAIVSIADGDKIVAQVADEYAVVRIAGQDITGEGNPDVVVTTVNHGPLLMLSTYVYDLGPTVVEVLKLHPFTCHDPVLRDGCPCGGWFQDLTADGIPELITCDDTYFVRWEVQDWEYSCAPLVLTVLQYEAGRGYVPAESPFADLYAPRIAWFRRRLDSPFAAKALPYKPGPPCLVMSLVLNLLYSGQPTEAWQELERRYTAPDRDLWWSQIVHTASLSQWHRLAGPLPDGSLPDHYMLALRADCGSADGTVVLLQQGQDVCDPGVVAWSQQWAMGLIRESGLLAPDEGIGASLSSRGGAGSLEVLDGNETLVGHIWLDTRGGFPGEVYRVNPDGTESVHMRLRGDFTWETAAE